MQEDVYYSRYLEYQYLSKQEAGILSDKKAQIEAITEHINPHKPVSKAVRRLHKKTRDKFLWDYIRFFQMRGIKQT